MELELGLKVTRTREDVSSSVDFRFSKDPFGPLVLSRETDSRFIIIIHLKGFKKEGIEIDINNEGDRITISGRKPVEEMVMIRWMAWRKEMEMRAFRKVFLIPNVVDLDKIKARFDDDDATLTITMPKRVRGISGFNLEQEEEEEEEGVEFGDASEVENREEVEEENEEREESDERSEVHGEEDFGEMVEDQERESQVLEGEEEGFSRGVDEYETQVEDDDLEKIQQTDEQDKVLGFAEEETVSQQELADSDRESEDSGFRKLPDIIEQEDNKEVMEQKVKEETKSGDIRSGAVEEIEEQESDEDSGRENENIGFKNLQEIIEQEDNQEVRKKKVIEETKNDDTGSETVGETEEQESREDSGLKKLPDIIEQEDNQEVMEQKVSEDNKSGDIGSGAVEEIQEQEESHEDSGLEKLPDIMEQEENQEVMEQKVSEEIKSKGIGSGAVEEIQEQESDEIGRTSEKKKTDDDDDDSLRKAQGIEEPERHDEKSKIQEMAEEETSGQEKINNKEAKGFDGKETQTEDGHLEKSQQTDEEERVGPHEFADSNKESEDSVLRKLPDILEQENNQDVMEQKDSEEETRRSDDFGSGAFEEIQKEEPHEHLDGASKIRETVNKATADDDGLRQAQGIKEPERRNEVSKNQETVEEETSDHEQRKHVKMETKSKDPKEDVAAEMGEGFAPVVAEDNTAETETKAKELDSIKPETDKVDKKHELVEKKEKEEENTKARRESEDRRSLIKLQENEEHQPKGRKGQEKQENVKELVEEKAPEAETNIESDVPKPVQETEAPEVDTVIKTDDEEKEKKKTVKMETAPKIAETGTKPEDIESEKVGADEVDKIHKPVEKNEEEDATVRAKGEESSLTNLQENEEQHSKERKGEDKQENIKELVEVKAPEADKNIGNDVPKPVQENEVMEQKVSEETKSDSIESEALKEIDEQESNEDSGLEKLPEDIIEKVMEQRVSEETKSGDTRSRAVEEKEEQESDEVGGTSNTRAMEKQATDGADGAGLRKSHGNEEPERHNEERKITGGQEENAKEESNGKETQTEEEDIEKSQQINEQGKILESADSITESEDSSSLRKPPDMDQKDSQVETPSDGSGSGAFEEIEKQEPCEQLDATSKSREMADDDGLSKGQGIEEQERRNEVSKIQEMVEGETSDHEKRNIVKMEIKRKDPKEDVDAEMGKAFTPNIERTPVVAETETKAEELESEKQETDKVDKKNELVEKKEEEEKNTKVRRKSEERGSLTNLQENEEQHSKGQKRLDKQETIKELVEEKTPEAETDMANDVPKPVQEIKVPEVGTVGETGYEGKQGKEKKSVANIVETETKPEEFESDKEEADEVDKIKKLVEKKEDESEVGTQTEDIGSIEPQEVGEQQSQGEKRHKELEKTKELVEEKTPEAEAAIENDTPKQVQEETNDAESIKPQETIRQQQLNERERCEKESKTQELLKINEEKEEKVTEEPVTKEQDSYRPTVLGEEEEKVQELAEDKTDFSKNGKVKEGEETTEKKTGLGDDDDDISRKFGDSDGKEEVDAEMEKGFKPNIAETETKPEDFESEKVGEDEVEKIHKLVEKKEEEVANVRRKGEDSSLIKLQENEEAHSKGRKRQEKQETIKELVEEKAPEAEVSNDVPKKVQEIEPEVGTLGETDGTEKKAKEEKKKSVSVEVRDVDAEEEVDGKIGVLNIAETETKPEEFASDQPKADEVDKIHELVEKKTEEGEENNAKVGTESEEQQSQGRKKHDKQEKIEEFVEEKTPVAETNIGNDNLKPVEERGEGKEKIQKLIQEETKKQPEEHKENMAETGEKIDDGGSKEVQEIVSQHELDEPERCEKERNILEVVKSISNDEDEAEKENEEKMNFSRRVEEEEEELAEKKTELSDDDIDAMKGQEEKEKNQALLQEEKVSLEVRDVDAKEEVDVKMGVPKNAETETRTKELESDQVKADEVDKIYELVEKEKEEEEEENAKAGIQSEDISLIKPQEVREQQFQGKKQHLKPENIEELVENQTPEEETNISNDILKPVQERGEGKQKIPKLFQEEGKKQPEEHKEKMVETEKKFNGAGTREVKDLDEERKTQEVVKIKTNDEEKEIEETQESYRPKIPWGLEETEDKKTEEFGDDDHQISRRDSDSKEEVDVEMGKGFKPNIAETETKGEEFQSQKLEPDENDDMHKVVEKKEEEEKNAKVRREREDRISLTELQENERQHSKRQKRQEKTAETDVPKVDKLGKTDDAEKEANEKKKSVSLEVKSKGAKGEVDAKNGKGFATNTAETEIKPEEFESEEIHELVEKKEEEEDNAKMRGQSEDSNLSTKIQETKEQQQDKIKELVEEETPAAETIQIPKPTQEIEEPEVDTLEEDDHHVSRKVGDYKQRDSDAKEEVGPEMGKVSTPNVSGTEKEAEEIESDSVKAVEQDRIHELVEKKKKEENATGRNKSEYSSLKRLQEEKFQGPNRHSKQEKTSELVEEKQEAETVQETEKPKVERLETCEEKVFADTETKDQESYRPKILEVEDKIQELAEEKMNFSRKVEEEEETAEKKTALGDDDMSRKAGDIDAMKGQEEKEKIQEQVLVKAENDKSRKTQEIDEQKSHEEDEPGNKVHELIEGETSGQGEVKGVESEKKKTEVDKRFREAQEIERTDSDVSGKHVKRKQELFEPERKLGSKIEEVTEEKFAEERYKTNITGIEEPSCQEEEEKEKSVEYMTITEIKDQRPDKGSNEKQYKIQELVEAGHDDHKEKQKDENLTVKEKRETEEETSKRVQETEQHESDGLSSSVLQDKKQETEEKEINRAEESRTKTDDVSLRKVQNDEDPEMSKPYKRQEEDKIQEPVEMGSSGYKEIVKRQDGSDISRIQEPGKPSLNDLERHGEREDKIHEPVELWTHDDREKVKKQDGDDVPQSVEDEKVENMAELEGKVEYDSSDKLSEIEERKSYEDWTHEKQEQSNEEATDPKESEEKEKTRTVEEEEEEIVKRRTRNIDVSLRKVEDDAEPELSKPYKPQEEDKVQESVERRTSDYREEVKKQDGNDTSRRKEEATGPGDKRTAEKVIAKAELKAEEDTSEKIQEIENQKSHELQRFLVQDTEEKEKTRAVEEIEIEERRTKTEDGRLRKVGDGKEPESSKPYKRDKIQELEEMETIDYREKGKTQDEEEATGPKDKHTGGKEEPVEEERYEKVVQTETKVEDENQKQEEMDDSIRKTQESEKEDSHEPEIHETLHIVQDFVAEETRDQEDEAAAVEANYDEDSSRILQTIKEHEERKEQINDPEDEESNADRETKEREAYDDWTQEERGIMKDLVKEEELDLKHAGGEGHNKEEKHEKKFIPKEEVKAEEASSEHELQRSLVQDTEEKGKPRSMEENETVEGRTETEDGSLRKVQACEDPAKLDIVQDIVEDKTWDQENERVGEQPQEPEEHEEQEEPATSDPRVEEGDGERVAEKETKMEKVHVQEPEGKTENEESRRGQKGRQEKNDETRSVDGIVRKVAEAKVQEPDEKIEEPERKEASNDGVNLETEEDSLIKGQEFIEKESSKRRPVGQQNMQRLMDAEKQEDEGKSESESEMQAKIGIRMKDQETKRQEQFEHDKILEPVGEGTKYQREEEKRVENREAEDNEDVSSRKVQKIKAEESDGLEKHRKLSGLQENESVEEEENEAGGYKEVLKTKSMEDSSQTQDVEEKGSDQTERHAEQENFQEQMAKKEEEEEQNEKAQRITQVDPKANDDSSKKNDTERSRGQEQKKDQQEVVEIETSDKRKKEREEKIVGKAVSRDECDSSKKNQEHEEEQLDKLERHGEEEMSGSLAREETNNDKEENRGNRAGAETTIKDDKNKLLVENDTSGEAKENRNQETQSGHDSSRENEKQESREQNINYEEQDKKKLGQNYYTSEEDGKEDKEIPEAEGTRKSRGIEQREATKMVESNDHQDNITDLVEEKMNNQEKEDKKGMSMEVLAKSEDHESKEPQRLRKQDNGSELVQQRSTGNLKDEETTDTETEDKDKESRKTHQLIEKETGEEEILKEKKNRETECEGGSSKKIQEIDKEGSSEPRRDEERDKIQPEDSETSEDDSEEVEVEVEDSEEDWEAEVIQEMDSDEDNDKLRKIRRIKLGFRLVGGSTLFMSLIVIVISIIRSKRKTRCYKF